MPETSSNPVKVVPLHVTLFAGACAGVSELLAMYPLDVVKTRRQLSADKAHKSIFATLGSIAKNEGAAVLYRGLLFPTLIEAPKRAVKFTANEMYKPLYSNLLKVKNERLLAMCTGISSGITEGFMITPAELIKVRLQDADKKSLYKGTIDCLVKIFKSEGISGLYRGLEATIWRHAVWNGAYFCSISNIRHIMPKAKTSPQKLLCDTISGMIGGTLGTVLNLPFDVAKSRIQGSLSSNSKYRWALPSAVTIAKEEGILALYKGFAPKVARFGPGGAIILIVYDFVVSILK